jgi:hypothetical protein
MRPARTTKLRIARCFDVSGGAFDAASIVFTVSGFDDGKGLEFRCCGGWQS